MPRQAVRLEGLLLVSSAVIAGSGGGIAVASDAAPEGLVVAARAPCPAGALPDGQVVEAESEEGGGGADEEAKEDVEAVVPEVKPATAGDEDRGEEGQDGDEEEV